MEAIVPILAHTPWWVFLLFAFLVWRGIRALAPAEVPLLQFLLLPTIFVIWGCTGLIERYGIDPVAFVLWLGALMIGTALGAMIVKGVALKGDRTRGMLYRPSDFTVLPLVLVAFGSKYVLAVIAATSPGTAGLWSFHVADLGIGGIFAGIFVGKLAGYLRAYLAG